MTSSSEKQSSTISWLLVITATCIAIFITSLILPALITSPREKMQEDLAKELGVKIQDYPYPSSFPSGYFYTVLKPGMLISEVHAVVQGYAQVSNCWNTAEVYSYFSAEQENAERFWLFYDEGMYKRFQGEGNDSGMLSTNGCVPGLIAE